jgi:hypothetical protein
MLVFLSKKVVEAICFQVNEGKCYSIIVINEKFRPLFKNNSHSTLSSAHCDKILIFLAYSCYLIQKNSAIPAVSTVIPTNFQIF